MTPNITNHLAASAIIFCLYFFFSASCFSFKSTRVTIRWRFLQVGEGCTRRRLKRAVRRPNRSTIVASQEGQSLVDPMLSLPGSLRCRRLRLMATPCTLCLGVAELDLELGKMMRVVVIVTRFWRFRNKLSHLNIYDIFDLKLSVVLAIEVIIQCTMFRRPC